VSHRKHLTCQLPRLPVTAHSAAACDHRAPLLYCHPAYITALAPEDLHACTPIFLRCSFVALQPRSLLICSAARAVLTSNPLSAYQL
jgi:hypothetical protein